MKINRKLLAGITVAGLILGNAGIAKADNVVNDVTAANEEKAVAVAGTGTVVISVVNTNSSVDGATGNNCNLSGQHTEIVLDVSSSDTSVATVSPARITIHDCDADAAQTVTVSGLKNGRATISFAQYSVRTSNNGSFNLLPARFTAVIGTGVAAPTDSTPPSWSCTPAAAAAAWQLAEGSHNCTAEDPSGLKAGSPASFQLTTSVGAGNENGNASTNSQRLCDIHDYCTTAGPIDNWMIDRKAPTVTNSGPTTSPNAAGWYKTDVDNEFAATDGGSGVNGASPFTKTTTGEGTAVKVSSGAVADNVGNSNPGIDSATFKIDKTAPTSTVSGVTEGAVYGVAPLVTCPATDQLGLSGVATDGSPSGNTTTAGQKTVTCNRATDVAGNLQTVASAAVTYTLAPIGIFNANFDGGPVLRVKPNQAIPLKWAFNDGTSNLALLSSASISSVSSNRCTVADSQDGTETATEVAAGASGLQLLPDNSYQMNWKATSTTGCRALTVTMNFTSGGSTIKTILVNIQK